MPTSQLLRPRYQTRSTRAMACYAARAMRRARSSWKRRLLLSAFGLGVGVAVSAAALAIWAAFSKRPRAFYEIVDPPGARQEYFRDDVDLGYGPVPSVRARARRLTPDRTIYDVMYTIGPDGLRVTPGLGDATAPAFLFFGCSFTFGEGVEDDETLPAQFARSLGRPANVVNFGFHGYGPHQMLRRLETDRFAGLIGGGVAHVFYQATPGHVRRAAGRVPWDVAGPWYEVEDGEARYRGPFRQSPFTWVMKALHRYEATSVLLEAGLGLGENVAADEERYVAIVSRAARLVHERGGAGFTVIDWDEPGDSMPERLAASGIDVVLVSKILGTSDRRRFHLRGDAHPNALAYRRIARALATEVTESSTPQEFVGP